MATIIRRHAGERLAGIRSIDISRKALRIGVVLAVLASAGALTATPASAFVSSHCHAHAADSTGKASPPSITIDNTDHWDVSKASQLSGSGTADSDQTFGYAYFSTFGYGIIPVAGGKGHGTTGHGSLDVSNYAGLVRVFAGIGRSDDCDGSLVVVVQDEGVLDTLAGKASLVAMALGVLGLALCLFCPDTIWEDWGP
jgi:hypothetical protein